MNSDRHYLDLAARAALRGCGDVEPNPMVGAVIARDGQVLGIGHHRRFGDLHAERDAIRNAASRGMECAGATIYVTLEPCSHTGKQPPCVDAILQARIARVVMARRDPNPVSGGGLEKLHAAGVAVEICSESMLAQEISRAFVRQVAPEPGKRGLPLVTAKWAQSLDGKIATRSGESKWISNPMSRKRVHRLRSRVDAILTGIGTVVADDPLLTARNVRRIRRTAKRVVIDSMLRLSRQFQLVKTAEEVPLIVVTTKATLATEQGRGRRYELEEAGALVLAVGADMHGRVNLREGLTLLSADHGCTNVMLECGPALLGSVFDGDLIDRAVVYLAPIVIGEQEAPSVAQGEGAARLALARRFQLERVKRMHNDLELWYSRSVVAD